MNGQNQQSVQMNEDEQRLLIFFRSLTLSQQFTLLESAGEQAMSRCLPEQGIYDFMPDAAGVEPKRKLGNIWSPYVEGTNVEIIRDGIEATGDPHAYLLGSSAYDEDEAVPRFAAAASKTATRQGSFYNYHETFAREYLHAWRMEIAWACDRVRTRMTQSIAEAEEQKIAVPDSHIGWIEFALTLDGDRIARELGWPEPGQFDTDLRGTLESLDKESECHESRVGPKISPFLCLRMALYEKLRFLQKRGELPPNNEQLEEIGMVLDWLRDRISKHQ